MSKVKKKKNKRGRVYAYEQNLFFWLIGIRFYAYEQNLFFWLIGIRFVRRFTLL